MSNLDRLVLLGLIIVSGWTVMEAALDHPFHSMISTSIWIICLFATVQYAKHRDRELARLQAN